MQEFAAPTERNERLRVDELPPAFAQLSPRDRERWHACHIFFLRPLGSRHPASVDALGFGDQGGLRRPSGWASFSATPAQYVDTPETERRAFLIRHGCPDSLVDLADGTHLDIIER